ncbi:MAG TPA: hypothetical protein PLE61_05655 [Vicinamibacterales bacterium]|nr:hypothetical protein [Vicinamibacterales bacterium]HOG29687.1 hypothetical protein [Vicinamibacterales bacterium]HOQ61428.1 hypothetical protein [Vicinamibacterales bacterium]HPW20283.1 hypothetical protein [Vicinamibacterales bacterium]
MAFTYHELKAKNISELRDIAKGLKHEAVQGYTQLNKEHLLVALCQALNVSVHEHHEAVGIDKAMLKATIRALKRERDAAIAAGDHAKLKAVRRQIHGVNRQIKKHLV